MAESSNSQQVVYEVALVGCGPAALSAAINLQIRRKKLLLLGVEFCTPKLHKSPRVDNYLGFPGIKGEDLREAFLDHVAKMGINIMPGRVEAVEPVGDNFVLQTGEGKYLARAVIIATGVSRVQPLPGEEEFLGRGLSYCATCDGPLFGDKEVAVLAYSPEGEGEAAFLAEICRRVYYFPLYQGEPAVASERVQVMKGKPGGVRGNGFLTHLELDGGNLLPVDGVFVIRETVPVDQLVPGVATTPQGAIQVDREMVTTVPGIFAAGDCTGGPYQLPKAVGEGVVAALSAVRYLDRKGTPSPAGREG